MVTEILAARSIREEKDLVALMTETLEFFIATYPSACCASYSPRRAA